MCELLLDDAKSVRLVGPGIASERHEIYWAQSTDPHCQLILYNVLLSYGRRRASFLRSHKRWQPLIPLLMDHIRLDLELDIDDGYMGSASGSGAGMTLKGIGVPIEAKLRLLSTGLLYEVCRVQKLSLSDLRACSPLAPRRT